MSVLDNRLLDKPASEHVQCRLVVGGKQGLLREPRHDHGASGLTADSGQRVVLRNSLIVYTGKLCHNIMSKRRY